MNQPTFDRLIPAICLGIAIILLGVHHWYAMTYGGTYAVAVLLLSMFGGLAAGGTVYPALFYALGAYGRHLPVYMKLIAGLCMACGLAAGFYLLFVVYAH